MPQDWPKLGQEGEHFEAQKWQNQLGIRMFRLSGEKLTSCSDILAGLQAARPNPQLNPAFWRTTWRQDLPKLGQERDHFEANNWQN